MAAHGSKLCHAIACLSDEKNITLDFFLMQAIYAGKAKQSQLHGFVCFQKFFKSQNPNYWSNETEHLSWLMRLSIHML